MRMPLSASTTNEHRDALYAKLTAAAVVFFVILEGGYVLLSIVQKGIRPPLDFTGYALGRDFINVWMGGHSVFSGGPAPWFDLQTYNQAIATLFGAVLPTHYWSYPPHLLLFTWPFGLMPYIAGYAFWCVAGIALYVLAAAQGDFRREHVLFLAVAPGVAICAFFGQNGFFTAALLIGGLLCMDRRPLLAGVLFGILTVKPQLGFLLPVMLLVSGRWRVIAAAVVTTAVLVALTSALFGPDIWVSYFVKIAPQQDGLLTRNIGLLPVMVFSVLSSTRLLGLSVGAAWVVQIVFSVAAIVAVAWTYWRRRDPELSAILLVTATLLATPWVLTYDLVVLGWVVDRLRRRMDPIRFDDRFLLVVWTLPVTGMLAALVHVPLAPVVLASLAGLLLWRLAQTESPLAADGPHTADPGPRHIPNLERAATGDASLR